MRVIWAKTIAVKPILKCYPTIEKPIARVIRLRRSSRQEIAPATNLELGIWNLNTASDDQLSQPILLAQWPPILQRQLVREIRLDYAAVHIGMRGRGYKISRFCKTLRSKDDPSFID